MRQASEVFALYQVLPDDWGPLNVADDRPGWGSLSAEDAVIAGGALYPRSGASPTKAPLAIDGSVFRVSCHIRGMVDGAAFRVACARSDTVDVVADLSTAIIVEWARDGDILRCRVWAQSNTPMDSGTLDHQITAEVIEEFFVGASGASFTNPAHFWATFEIGPRFVRAWAHISPIGWHRSAPTIAAAGVWGHMHSWELCASDDVGVAKVDYEVDPEPSGFDHASISVVADAGPESDLNDDGQAALVRYTTTTSLDFVPTAVRLYPADPDTGAIEEWFVASDFEQKLIYVGGDADLIPAVAIRNYTGKSGTPFEVEAFSDSVGAVDGGIGSGRIEVFTGGGELCFDAPPPLEGSSEAEAYPSNATRFGGVEAKILTSSNVEIQFTHLLGVRHNVARRMQRSISISGGARPMWYPRPGSNEYVQTFITSAALRLSRPTRTGVTVQGVVA